MTKRRMIRWSQDDVDRLASEVASMRVSDVSSTIVQIANKAQERIFPASRRRKIVAMQNIRGFEDKVRLKSVSMPERIVEKIIERVVEIKVPAALSTVSDEALFAELCSRFSSMRQSISSLVENQAHVQIRQVAIDTNSGKQVDLHKIAVIGMLKGQFQDLYNRTKGMPVELVYYDKETSPREVLAGSAIVERHVSHSWNDQVVNSVPKNRIAFCGGITDAIKAVELFSK